jgi:WD repeat-containing protein 23
MSAALPGAYDSADEAMDADYYPGEHETDIDDFEDDEEDELDVTMDADDDPVAGDQEEDDDQAAGGEMRLGIDPRTQRIYVIHPDGRQSPLRDGNRLSFLQSLLAGGRATRTGTRATVADDDDDNDWGLSRRRSSPIFRFPTVTEPVKEGVELGLSGDFGRLPRQTAAANRRCSSLSVNLADTIRKRSIVPQRLHRQDISEPLVPNTEGTEVVRHDANVYCGQYSDDGSFFYTASQDFRIRIYKGETPVVSGKGVSDDARYTSGRRYGGRYGGGSDRSSLKLTKSIQAHDAYSRWTTTDASLAPDNNSLIYSSISEFACLNLSTQLTTWQAPSSTLSAHVTAPMARA